MICFDVKRFIVVFALGALLLSSTRAEGEFETNNSDENGTYSNLERVVLFNSGIGYFERSIVVKRGAPLRISFKSEDINDVLKSLVFFDVKGTKIERVDYPSKLPLDKILESFMIDLSDNDKLFSILEKLRGEKVEVKGNNSYEGRILSVEKRQKDDRYIIYLNLLTSEGLVSESIDSIKTIHFIDPRVEFQLHEYLSLIAEEHNRERKELVFHFTGQRDGSMHIAYMMATPVWKMSYRLVLNENSSELQGWAIVENTTEDDWRGVLLSLVSGNPVSFKMDLYTPRFVERPEIEVPLPETVEPQIYEGAMEEEYEKPETRKTVPLASLAASMEKKMKVPTKKMDIAGGVSIESKGEVKGNFFSYSIDSPITIPIHRSAMIPVINTKIDGNRIVVYNEDVLATHPLNGYEIKNSTGIYLAPGPISVFEDGIFAGDAEIDTVAPDENRLITFSIDYDTEIKPERKSMPQLIESVKIVRGILESKIKLQRSVIYKINNRGKNSKKVLIEKKSDPDWRLVEPYKPYETARDRYRFLVDVGGVESEGHVKALTVKEERVIGKQVALIGADVSGIDFYLKSGNIGENVKRALERLAKMKKDLAGMKMNLKQLDKKYSVLSSDQSRIRNNMRNLDRKSELYKRYVEALNSQEDEIEKIFSEREKLTKSIDEKKNEIVNYLNSLDIE